MSPKTKQQKKRITAAGKAPAGPSTEPHKTLPGAYPFDSQPEEGPLEPYSFETQPNQPATEAAPAPAFGTSLLSSGFNFSVPSTYERDYALARANKSQGDLEEAKQYYHDIVVGRDERIDGLETHLKNLTAELAAVKKEKHDTDREVRGYKEIAENATAAKNKAEEDLKFQKGVSECDKEMSEKLHKENIEQDEEIKAGKEVLRKFKERVAEHIATIEALHKQVDDLESQRETLQTDNGNLALQHEHTENEVSQANKEFEEMFKDIGRDLDLNGYVSHVRDMLSTGQLQRKDSSVSLEQQLSPQKSFQDFRTIAAKSLQEQMEAVSDTSSEHSVPIDGDAEDEDDDTLTSLGLGRPFTEYDYYVRLQDQEKKIAELTRQNKELLNAAPVAETPSQNFGFSQIQTVDTTPASPSPLAAETVNPSLGFSKVEAVDAAPGPVAETPSQNLGLSKIQIVDTTPASPSPVAAGIELQRLGFSKIESVDTAPVPVAEMASQSHESRRIQSMAATAAPPRFGLGEFWQRAPWFYKLLVFMLLTLYVVLVANVARERYVWLSANDLTRKQVIRMSAAGNGLFTPMIMAIDQWVGVDYSMMG